MEKGIIYLEENFGTNVSKFKLQPMELRDLVWGLLWGREDGHWFRAYEADGLVRLEYRTYCPWEGSRWKEAYIFPVSLLRILPGWVENALLSGRAVC